MTELTQSNQRGILLVEARRDRGSRKAPVTFTKVTVCPGSDDVPVVGRVQNGGMTLTIPLTTPYNVDYFNEALARGNRIVRMWSVTV